jgi:indolepyruvate ferredoxin oxidoreductase beta subunit
VSDIFLAGVGGQGIITASRIIGDAALLAGKNVLLSETHGMAQRGGSVVCTARIGDAHGALILDGRADVILGFELLETLRALPKASRSAAVISSNETIVPLSVSTQKLHYPTLEEAKEEILKAAGKLLFVDARKLAAESGVPMSSNVVMIGALAGSGCTGLPKAEFARAVELNITRKVSENITAFNRGFDEARSLSL